jgi:hypothetical protein
VVDLMRAKRRPGESYSEVILRLVEMKTSDLNNLCEWGPLRSLRAERVRLRRQPRIGRFTADKAVIVSDLLMRTFNVGPLRGSFHQTYHA